MAPPTRLEGFHPSKFPSLPVHKALLILDAQTDFLSSTGALPVKDPEAFVARISRLVTAFRAVGKVFWIRSEFVEPRPFNSSQIITSHTKPSTRAATSRVTETFDAEAFLTFGQKDAACVKPNSEGSELAPGIKELVDESDDQLTKTDYSAFKDTDLAHRLNRSFATDLYLCGSLVNVSVYATALDAARAGKSITIVEDCCSWREGKRRENALRNLDEIYGCSVVSCKQLVRSFSPRRSLVSEALADVTKQRKEKHESDLAGAMKSLAIEDSPLEADDGPILESDRDEKETEEPIPESDSPGRVKNATDSTPLRPGPSITPTPMDPEQPADASAESREEQTRTPEPKSNAQGESRSPTATAQDPTDTIAGTDSKHPECDTLHRVCEGDTSIIYNVLPKDVADAAFEKLKTEVKWQNMSHVGGEVPRLVAVQGTVSPDGSVPIYRHPADESPPLKPFTSTVLQLKEAVEKHLNHTVNHVLIQYYRTGRDYISEHSDKTLDIDRLSYIANLSLGAQRTMVFRTKRAYKAIKHTPSASFSSPSPGPSSTEPHAREIQRAKLPHNSLVRMGLYTNKRWLHAIKQDKRLDRDKSEEELAFESARISLTFRKIATFLDKEEERIWGQGAKGKGREEAAKVVNGKTDESEKLRFAFGTENH